MLNMTKKSKLGAKEALRKAVAFFGPEGLGLKVTQQEETCARFQGGGGHVFVTVCESEGGNGSEIDVESREWDYQVRQFLAQV
jgi:hypothetical protein